MDETARLGETIKELLAEGRDERLADVLEDAHPADVSRVIRELPPDEQVRVFRLVAPQRAGAVLSELDDPILRGLIGSLGDTEVSRIFDRMPTDHVVEVVEELPKEQAEGILELMEEEKSEEVQELLEYGEGTAGRLMSPEFIAVHERATVAQALEHIRKAATGDDAFYVWVVDDHDHLVGLVPLHRLLAADPATPISAIRNEDVEAVSVDTDQEEVARLVQHYNVIEVPVVDANRRLLGTIGVEDVIDVIREEATEDIQRLGGVAGDETVLDPPRTVFGKRLVWRLVNLGTAVLAASVIGLFEGSIQALATLAVFMPIVASMGGIGTTQTATVVVRGIALGDMTASVLRRVLWKELWLGLTTGAANGLVIAAIAWLWKGQILLSLILGVALVFNMLVAAVVGTLIPMALKTFRVDPAIASSVIITTFTDVFGFFSFLGLATLLIRFLL
ncbi:MAG: magnesium transporter [Candidatus Rokubacteria bacterium]|nr:magnesium transporter [Candidatus Rokubacteria bacterium]MBI2157700.1 magnesium transporter [Candidatus Rokubacteria bacterium]MBI2494588.1 magnesium transporter [Candidatus Rokubacteria bacterium]